MAAVVGRLTGRPGVCIATSGPGASNLTTGLATATTEGDPVLAIVGIVPRAQSHRHTHQSLSIPNLLSSVCKSVSVNLGTLCPYLHNSIYEAMLTGSL